MASASLIFWLMRASLARSHTSKASASGHEATLFRAAAADLLLDPIECGDVLQRLACDRRRAGCREFVEVAPHVHPAEGELDLACRSIESDALAGIDNAAEQANAIATYEGCRPKVPLHGTEV
jgi:hypothetical protein